MQAPLGLLAPLCWNKVSLLCAPSCPTSTTCTCCKGALHFIVYLGPTGTRLLISGGPLVEMRRKKKQPQCFKREILYLLPIRILLTALHSQLHERIRPLKCHKEDLGELESVWSPMFPTKIVPLAVRSSLLFMYSCNHTDNQHCDRFVKILEADKVNFGTLELNET